MPVGKVSNREILFIKIVCPLLGVTFRKERIRKLL